jgi:ElaB/YqjD/DUF883 family membrane-anchored ribosome-binding protein
VSVVPKRRRQHSNRKVSQQQNTTQIDEVTTMNITDKVSDTAHAAFDKTAEATNQAGETHGEKGEQLKKTEQQLMKKSLSYVRNNPWVTQ